MRGSITYARRGSDEVSLFQQFKKGDVRPPSRRRENYDRNVRGENKKW
jgi:hypothetical protein